MNSHHGILVVDSTTDSGFLVEILENGGYDVRAANSGEQALEAIEAMLPEIVLMDVRLPGIGGFEVCRRIKSSSRTRCIPVLFLTSFYDPQERQTGLAIGGVDFITRPYQPEKILARVNSNLEQNRLQRRLDAQVHASATLLHETAQRIIVENAEKEMAEKALQESQERYRQLVENAPVGIFQRSLGGTLLYVNPGLARLFGCATSVEFMERFSNVSKCWKDPMQNSEYNEILMEKGRVDGFEAEFNLAGGGTKWLSLHSFYDQATCCINGFAIDINSLKLAQMAQAEMKSQLERSQKLESIGNLAGGIAHDFNNFLTVSLFNAEFGMEATGSDNPLWQYFSEIFIASKHSASLTKQLLSFARKEPVDPVVMDLNQGIEEMLALMRRLLGEHIELVWRPGRDLGNIRMDPSQIDQIVANLCINARDAINRQGRIVLSTERIVLREEDAGTLGEVPPGEYARLSVVDNGCGMAPDVLARIFEPFFTTKSPGKGTGLGLSTVFGIVRQNGGFVQVDSLPGVGTTFYVLLPATKDPVAERPGGSKLQQLPQGQTILLVDDSLSVRNAIKTVLDKLGHNVLVASGPQEALAIACRNTGSIDLLLTDFVMPGMNGKDLAEQIGILRPAIRVIFMTGYEEDFNFDRTNGSRTHPVLQKPLSVGTLVSSIHRTLEAR